MVLRGCCGCFATSVSAFPRLSESLPVQAYHVLVRRSTRISEPTCVPRCVLMPACRVGCCVPRLALQYLRITNHSDEASTSSLDAERRKPVIMVLGRQHPGESASR